MSNGVAILDPLTDARWDEFVERHAGASVFHSRGWLEALKRTYGYEPLALTTTGRGPLQNAVVLCRVSTWVSRRLVSLPFSDHCEPLVDRPDDLSAMLAFLASEMEHGRWRSLELRPRHGVPAGLAKGASYCLHTLDISRPPLDIFKAFHRSSIQQVIRRAERERIEYESGSSERLISAFYGLLRLARRRHGLPPQPLAWFRNLVACLGDGLTIHVASRDGRPIATMLTASFKKTLVYKYGGSDADYHRLGGMPFLFWHAIQDAKAQGIEEFDLGRSDPDQHGLIAFKDHLGASRTTLTYYTRPELRPDATHAGPLSRLARKVVPVLPDVVLDWSGRFLYRHLG